MDKVRIGIIGCGGVANGKHMPNLKKMDAMCEMVAFCDLIPEKAEKAAATYGIEGADVYTDYRKLLERKDIDCVHVLTPNIAHDFISIDALNAGKHVMCEKPMATSYEKAMAMCAAAKKNNKLLTIGYQFRSMLNIQYLHKLAAEGELGDIYFARCVSNRRRGVPTWGVFLDKEKQGGGPLIDCATHELDWVLWVMNNFEPVSVYGRTYNYLGRDPATVTNPWYKWNHSKFEVEDAAFAFITFKNGATVSLETSWALNIADGCRSVFCGTKAGADLMDGVRVNGERDGALWVNTYEVIPQYRPKFQNEKLTEYEYEMKQWLDAIQNGGTPHVLPEEAAVVSQILEGIYKSAETGQVVYFDR